MKIVDVAEEIFSELGSPSTISITSVSYWLRSNIGKLNTIIAKDYLIDTSTLEVSPSLGEEEKSIFKKMYEIVYYESKIRENLGAASSNSVVEISSDGGRIRKISSNEIARSFAKLKSEELDALEDLISSYKLKVSGPLQVAGDDTTPGTQNVQPPYRERY